LFDNIRLAFDKKQTLIKLEELCVLSKSVLGKSFDISLKSTNQLKDT